MKKIVTVLLLVMLIVILSGCTRLNDESPKKLVILQNSTASESIKYGSYFVTQDIVRYTNITLIPIKFETKRNSPCCGGTLTIYYSAMNIPKGVYNEHIIFWNIYGEGKAEFIRTIYII